MLTEYLWADCTHLGSSKVRHPYKVLCLCLCLPLPSCKISSLSDSALHHSLNLCFSSPTSVSSSYIFTSPPSFILAYVIPLVLFWCPGSIHLTHASLLVLYILLLWGLAFYNLSASHSFEGSHPTPNDLFSDFCHQPWLLFWAPQLPVTTSASQFMLKPLILLLPKTWLS